MDDDFKKDHSLKLSFDRVALRDALLAALAERLAPEALKPREVEDIVRHVRALLNIAGDDPELATALELLPDKVAERGGAGAGIVLCEAMLDHTGLAGSVFDALLSKRAGLVARAKEEDLRKYPAIEDVFSAVVQPDDHPVARILFDRGLKAAERQMERGPEYAAKALRAIPVKRGEINERYIRARAAELNAISDLADGVSAARALEIRIGMMEQVGQYAGALAEVVKAALESRADRPLAEKAVSLYGALFDGASRALGDVEGAKLAADMLGPYARDKKGVIEELRRAFGETALPWAQAAHDRGDHDTVLKIAYEAEGNGCPSPDINEDIALDSFITLMRGIEEEQGIKAAVLKAKTLGHNWEKLDWERNIDLSRFVARYLFGYADFLLNAGEEDFIVSEFLKWDGTPPQGFLPGLLLTGDKNADSAGNMAVIVTRTADQIAAKGDRAKAAKVLHDVLQAYSPVSTVRDEGGISPWDRIAERYLTYADMFKSEKGLDRIVRDLASRDGVGFQGKNVVMNVLAEQAEPDTLRNWVNPRLKRVPGIGPEDFAARLKGPA
jgi:hypothetical protein